MTSATPSSGSFPDRTFLTADELREEVAAILELPVSEVTADDDLLDLGMDSVRLMTLVQRWKDRGVLVEFADLAERTELGAWIELVAERV